MRRVFADSTFYVALLSVDDVHHERAVELGSDLIAENAHLATSHAVIFEVFAFFSRKGPTARRQASAWATRIQDSASVDIVRTTDALLASALVS